MKEFIFTINGNDYCVVSKSQASAFDYLAGVGLIKDGDVIQIETISTITDNMTIVIPFKGKVKNILRTNLEAQ